jgi:hypothetical protein
MSEPTHNADVKWAENVLSSVHTRLKLLGQNFFFASGNYSGNFLASRRDFKGRIRSTIFTSTCTAYVHFEGVKGDKVGSQP